MERMVLQGAACACFLGGTPQQGLPKGEGEEGQDGGWCPGNCQKVRGTWKSYTNTTPAKGEGCGFFIERNEIFFLNDHESQHRNFPRGLQQTHPSFHPICFPFVNLKVML